LSQSTAVECREEVWALEILVIVKSRRESWETCPESRLVSPGPVPVQSGLFSCLQWYCFVGNMHDGGLDSRLAGFGEIRIELGNTDSGSSRLKRAGGIMYHDGDEDVGDDLGRSCTWDHRCLSRSSQSRTDRLGRHPRLVRPVLVE